MRTPHVSRLPVRRAAVALLAGLAAAASQATAASSAENNLLQLSAPIKSWDEAIPLGNGLMGGLLWGGDNVVRLSLDRGDLWDERPHHEPGWWKNRPWHKGGDWDGPYNGVTPTKLPAGRLEITLDPAQKIESFSLRKETAEGIAHLTDGGALRLFYSAAQPVALMRITGPEPVALDLIPSGAKRDGGDTGPSSGGAVAKLGYPPAKHGTDGRARWYVQDAVGGFQYCAFLETRRVGDATLVALTVTSTNDGPDVLALARERCTTALEAGYDAMLAPHSAWWREFWAQSSLTVPEESIQKYYELCRYYYGAASRRGAPPMPLQGLWTADEGGLPPWKGDYHNDLNTQTTYIAQLPMGHADAGLCFLQHLANLQPTFERFARSFYAVDGLVVPGVMTLEGRAMGGWGQYSLSPTNTAWLALLFDEHWRYTRDRKFLESIANPWCAQAGRALAALLSPDSAGHLRLPLSSSPEIFDNSPRSWLPPNSNYDLMSMQMQFLALVEMADALGKADDVKRWQAVVDGLEDFHAADDGTLLVAANTPLPHSHRHLSNIIGLFPSTSSPSRAANRMCGASGLRWPSGTGSAPRNGAGIRSRG
jgi:alpha-L-fucosidase 2